MQARCTACGPGQYCPRGTYIAEEGDANAMSRLDCPAGSYCPTPGAKLGCPAGSYCPARSTGAITCSYTELLDSPMVRHGSAAPGAGIRGSGVSVCPVCCDA